MDAPGRGLTSSSDGMPSSTMKSNETKAGKAELLQQLEADADEARLEILVDHQRACCTAVTIGRFASGEGPLAADGESAAAGSR